MRILLVFLATSLAAGMVEGQTIRVHPSAQYMPLRVFDATGKLMAGTTAENDLNEPMAVTFLYSPTSTGKGQTFTLRIRAAPSEGHVDYRWAQVLSDTFYFESSDCTGQAYVESPGPMPGRRLALIDSQTNLLYLSEANPTVAAKIYDSLRHPLGSCLETGQQSFLAVAVDPVIDMDDFFTLPFEIR
jgi:hypothetical protein